MIPKKFNFTNKNKKSGHSSIFFQSLNFIHDYIIVNKVNSNIVAKKSRFYLQELLRKYCINIFISDKIDKM